MGLAASQARYLALTARKSDLEFQSQTINTRRIQLAYKTAEIARAYSEGMNNQRIKMVTGQDKNGKDIYSELNFQNLMEGGYMLIGINGTGLNPSPYIEDDNYADDNGTTSSVRYIPKKGTISAADYKGLNSSVRELGIYIPNEKAKAESNSEYVNSSNKSSYEPIYKDALTKEEYDELDNTSGTDTIDGVAYNWEYVKVDDQYVKKVTSMKIDNTEKEYADLSEKQKGSLYIDGSNYYLATGYNEIVSYKIDPNITTETYNKLKAIPGVNADDYYESAPVIDHHYKVNPGYKYEDKQGLNVQSLLTSGRAQIVSKAFFDYLVSQYGFSLTEGMTLKQFQKALDEWGDDSVNPGKAKSIIDWSSDETNTFQQQNYTEDDAAVLAKYTADTAEIQAQDKRLEMEEKNIETQHKAIEVELESIQKVIQNNIDKTFKIFS